MPGTTRSPARSCPTRPVDVVVVGADALGAATAWWLARAGASVVLLDERTPRELRLAVRGTAWSTHPAWTPADEPLAEATAAWRRLERDTGAALLTSHPALTRGPLGEEEAGTAWLVRADHAVAALTAVAAGAGAVVRHRTSGAVRTRDGQGVEIDVPGGPLRARHAVVTAVDAAPVRGLELHFTPHHPLSPRTPSIARHDPELGLVRAVPCAQGHLAVGAATWPRGTVRDLRDHVRTWFPEVDAEHPEPVGPDAMSTLPAALAVTGDGPVTTATTTALGSVAVIAHAHRLAERVLAGEPAGAAALRAPA